MKGAIVGLMYLVAGILSLAPIASAAPPEGPVKSVLVVENGRPVGSVTAPRNGRELVVRVTEGEQQLQAYVQIQARQGERLLLMTALVNSVVTSLSGNGVAGTALAGGWDLAVDQGTEVLVTVAGTNPVGIKEYDLVQVIRLADGQVSSEVRVRAVVQPGSRQIPLVWAIAGAAAALLMIGAGLFWWKRRQDTWQRADGG